MRTRFLSGVTLWTFLATATLTTGCSDDDYKDVDGQSPSLELSTEHIRTLIGHEFSIVGKIADKDGIRSVRLQNSDLYLDKTIDLQSIYQEPLYEYELNYAFTIPQKTVGDSFTVKVIVTDLGGRTTENSVLITMDGDYTAPTLNSISPSSDQISLVLSEGTTQQVKFTAKDNKGLDYVEVVIPELEISDRLAAWEKEDGTLVTELKYDHTFTFPSNKPGTYEMTLRAVDLLGNQVEKAKTVVVAKVKDYTYMYYIDFEGTDTALLTNDVWGVPMSAERTGNFEYIAHCYSPQAGTPIRFLAKTTSVAPSNFNICFGDDKNNPGHLTGIAEDVTPILLPNKGYYDIKFNTNEGTYTLTAVTPENAPIMEGSTQIAYNEGDGGRAEYQFVLGIVGAGFKGATGWNPNNVYPMHQDVNNPYVYTTELVFEKSDYLDCTITPYHPWNWWISPSWRFDGANNRFVAGDTVPNSKKYISKGTYTLVLDTYLSQTKLLKK